MGEYISDKLRLAVAKRAYNLCEYCLIHQSDSFFTFHIDHIISLKHGGTTILKNLANSCAICNRNKSSDVGTILLPKYDFIRLYNPRIDNWNDHFYFNEAEILPNSKIGQATIKILDLNEMNRLIERNYLIKIGHYPHKNLELYLDD